MILEHNSTKLIYRYPHGAVPTETKVRLRISVRSNSIPDKVLCLMGGETVPMHYVFDINDTRMYECSVQMPQCCGLVFYSFFAEADGEARFYGNNEKSLGGIGRMSENKAERLYQITVYDKSFKTPDWMKNAVVYQIFPDRFFRSGNTPFHGIERKWGEEPFFTKEQFGGEYLSNDFFGGNLKGIEEKLDYLSELGVTAIYLNPIFKSPSNHRYDTSDYTVPDPTLGTVRDFESLAEKAKKKNIRIILDGVFSHTGADSIYFNKYNTFDSLGAYQSENSPYYSWYSFGATHDDYESWWGFKTLPNVNELDKGFLDYIVEGENAITKKWIKHGASGWRLDVADELPDEFIGKMRQSIKEGFPDALILGEVWEDASNKVSYGTQRRFLWGKWLDSVMNYVFRDAVLEFLTQKNAELFCMKIKSLYENYPKEALYASMNLISSHDVPRAMTVLSDAPDVHTMDRICQQGYRVSGDDYQKAQARMILAEAIQFTMPGAPTVYYGDEIGLTGYADPFNRQTYPWDAQSILRDYTRKFAHLRNNNDCLRTGEYRTIYYFNGVFCYMRMIENNKDIFGSECDNGCFLIIVNSSDFEENITLDLGRFGASALINTDNGEKTQYNHGVAINLPPVSYRIFEIERNSGECIKIRNTF